MKRTKIISLSLGCLIALGAFAGCSTTSGTEGTTKASEAVTSEATSETTVLSAVTAETSATASVEESSVISETSDTPVIVEASDDKIVLSDDGRQAYVNEFISKFVEQYFWDYERDYDNVEQRLDFVHIYLRINSWTSIGYEQKGDVSFETFSVEQAQEIVRRFFGVLLKEEDIKAYSVPPSTYGDQPAGPYYEDGKIWYEAAYGEGYNQIGIVDSAFNNGDGTITLEFTIYSIAMETFWDLDSDDIKAYYRMTPDEAANDNTLSMVRTGRAVAGVAQSGEYYLISYDT